MIIGMAVIEIHVHESQSLKAKRGVVRSITGRLRNKFNVSVGEVGGQGTWQRATLGLSMTGSDEVSVRRSLQKAVDFVEDTHLAQIIQSDLDVIRVPISGGITSEFSDGSGLPEPDENEDLPWASNLGFREQGEPGAED